MESWSIIWQNKEVFLQGLWQTLVLFGISSITAFVAGIGLLIALEGQDNGFRRAIRVFVDGMRMIPCLIYAYLLYYGLPELGLRLDAWTAGLIALSTYHAAYFAEIFRGARNEISPGQVEAARAHGLRTPSLFSRIIIPQIFLKTGPALGNQLIICLKDTSFLTIITVTELTSAAMAIQAQYFVPVQAFAVAIALYWFVCLFIEWGVRRLGRAAFQRGLSS